MEKHLLVTVSEQQKNLHADRFVGHFFNNKDPLHVTLFYTAPRPPALWEGERTLEGEAQRGEQFKTYETQGRKALEGAKKALITRGFRSEHIRTKLQFRKFTKVMDIIQEGEEGLYDAVVMGRRGLSWLEEAFDGSVTRELLHKKVGFPLWICRRPDLQRKHVLLCADGSEESIRAADHVGFILSDQEDQNITLLTVVQKRSRSDSDAIFRACSTHLESSGFPKERIRTSIVESGHPAKAILREAETGRFGAVAVGRTGRGRGFFMGSVSTALFKELERASLWICY